MFNDASGNLLDLAPRVSASLVWSTLRKPMATYSIWSCNPAKLLLKATDDVCCLLTTTLELWPARSGLKGGLRPS